MRITVAVGAALAACGLALGPWYEGDFGETLRTPEWTFARGDLRWFQPS